MDSVSIVSYEHRDMLGRIVQVVDSVYADEQNAEERAAEINTKTSRYPGMTADVEEYALADVSPERVNNNAKLSWSTVRHIRKRHAAGESVADMARAYGVQAKTIRAIVQGRTWQE